MSVEESVRVVEMGKRRIGGVGAFVVVGGRGGGSRRGVRGGGNRDKGEGGGGGVGENRYLREFGYLGGNRYV